MQSMRRPQRLAQATITLLVVFGLAVALPMPADADEKLGETAIDAAYDQLSPEEPAEEEAPPPAEETQTASEPEASGAAEPAPAADSGTAATTASTAPAEETAPATDTAAATNSGGSGEIATAQQATAEQPAERASGDSDGNDRSASSAAQGVADNAISNVLSGAPALTVDPALEAAAPISGGTAAGSGSGSGDSGLRDQTSEQAADLRAAGNSLRPSTVGPARNRSDGEPREGDGGTVVVNGLEDSGDEGKVAVHGHIVAGTLCDGSQFWSLDGGGTVNANGVNLSANGGTAVTDASGGDDNRGGAAGNGGSAGASADGGIVVVDSLVTGNNSGNQVSVGDQTFTGDCGQGVIDGGDATTINNVNISADGGTAVADASGGDDNVAGNGGSAGNGGTARASADGGIVIVGDLILGNNEGNEVNVGSGGSSGAGNSGGCLVDGGSVTTIANIDISADGGLAGADASGGDDNAAFGEDAAAGNGGRARANADGGLILAGDIIAGNNQGNTINGQCGGAGGGSGSTFVYGGDVTNQTTLTLNADGGAAFADASGGDDNVAAGGRGDDIAAGNGGRARADASGGVIQVGDIVTGNNVGNVIAFGASNLAAVPERDDEKKPRLRTIKPTFAAPSKQGARTAPKQGVRSQPAGRNARAVGKLPNTGSGPELVAGSHTAATFVFAGIALFGIAALVQVAPGRHQLLAAAPERASRTVRRDERPT